MYYVVFYVMPYIMIYTAFPLCIPPPQQFAVTEKKDNKTTAKSGMISTCSY